MIEGQLIRDMFEVAELDHLDCDAAQKYEFEEQTEQHRKDTIVTQRKYPV